MTIHNFFMGICTKLKEKIMQEVFGFLAGFIITVAGTKLNKAVLGKIISGGRHALFLVIYFAIKTFLASIILFCLLYANFPVLSVAAGIIPALIYNVTLGIKLPNNLKSQDCSIWKA